MAYTPELSMGGSATLRRLAWFLKEPMTKTLERLVEMTARHTAQISHGAICTACKDAGKCSICAFNTSESTIKDEKAKKETLNTTLEKFKTRDIPQALE